MHWVYLFFLFFAHSSAFRISLKKSKLSHLHRRAGGTNFSLHKPSVNAASSDSSLDVSTVRDLLYMANVTIGGTAYTVQLDTGSSDLWVKGDTTPLPNSNPTSTTYNLTYGIGWAYGHLSYASVDFAEITVPSQAFLDVSSVQNPALSYGADGILGLGFTSLSTLDALVNGTGSSAGRSLLYNLFSDNPSEPNFISFALQRSTEPNDEVEGTFTIGEYEPEYADVANNAPISTWPENSPKRWTVLVDALLTGGTAITPTTGVTGAPSNKAVALLDSGTSWTYAPEAICTAIYGSFQGATFSTDLQQWVLPCDTEVDIALQIGGQVFPIHPLDTLPYSPTDSKTCVGSFVPQSVAVGAGEFDWLIGDNVLRAVYSVYDFGDFDANKNMGNPYIKLFSLVDPNNASAEFVKVRGGTAKTNITYNASNNTSSQPSSVTLSGDVADTINKLNIYFPVMIGVLALNGLVFIALLVVAVVYLCQRRRRRARAARIRTPNGRLTPMPISSRNSYIAGSPPAEQHVYEPVSMAITEDTMFAPLSPGLRKFDTSSVDRPHSMATLPSLSRLYQQIGSEDALVAPSAPFAKVDRPKSLGMDPSTQPDFIAPARGEDEPFTPPAIALYEVNDNMSLKSGKSGQSGKSFVEDASMPEQFALPPSRPVSILSPDRPRSIVVPPPIRSPEDDLMPPSPGFSAGFVTAEQPRPGLITSSPSSRYPPPPAPRTASPRFAGGNALRPNPNFAAMENRPMSVGMLPSQYTPQSPAFHRQGSSLRPGAERSPAAAVPGNLVAPHHQNPGEEDITASKSPVPPFHRVPSDLDRPLSMA